MGENPYMEKGPSLEGKFLPIGADLLGRVEQLYARMNEAYSGVADGYGFDCTGCEDNCCTQRFHHHTLAEYFYLLEGLRKADRELAGKIIQRAREVVEAYGEEGHKGRTLPLMCPVNFDGLCHLYSHRPMICRLHGLPHLFRRPDGVTVQGGGCQRFEALHRASIRMDRTVFYTELASIEKDLRVRLGFTGRYKKTTAQMLLDMDESLRMEGQ
jgi:Fe-S-cluster containining protein